MKAPQAIEAVAGEQPHALALALDDQPVAVVLDFVNPFRPVRDFGSAPAWFWPSTLPRPPRTRPWRCRGPWPSPQPDAWLALAGEADAADALVAFEHRIITNADRTQLQHSCVVLETTTPAPCRISWPAGNRSNWALRWSSRQLKIGFHYQARPCDLMLT